MDTLQSLSEQKTYYLKLLTEGKISQDSYDKIMDYIERLELEVKSHIDTV